MLLNNENEADIFEREQVILDNAVKHSNEAKKGQPIDTDVYNNLVKEYGRLLKQLRRMTKIYDKATDSLNMSKLDLMDKVRYDALTGIYNRRYLDENIDKIVEALSIKKDELCVMMLDVDFFKRYNDTYGHSEGDECLRRIAKTIAESLTRESDFVARYGGEEFVVLLPNMDENMARVTANRILENIRAQDIMHEANEVAPYVTISIGVTSSRVLHAQTGEDYIKRADEALYLSKKRGRNRYTYIDFKGEK